MKKLGCLVVIVLVVLIAWFTRAAWIRVLPGSGKREAVGGTATTAWQSLTPSGAQRAKSALDQLRAPNGPAFAAVAPGELAAYIMQELSRTLPRSADSVEAAAIGDRLYVRAVVRTADLGDKRTLGPIAALFGERERLQLGGTLRIIRPGLAELQVKELKIRDFNIPQALIPRLIRQISPRDRPVGLSPDGLALRTPDYIGDVRVSDGVITMYRASPSR
jgi:hypothetical protein